MLKFCILPLSSAQKEGREASQTAASVLKFLLLRDDVAERSKNPSPLPSSSAAATLHTPLLLHTSLFSKIATAAAATDTAAEARPGNNAVSNTGAGEDGYQEEGGEERERTAKS